MSSSAALPKVEGPMGILRNCCDKLHIPIVAGYLLLALVSYAMAARVLELLEKAKIISPSEGGK